MAASKLADAHTVSKRELSAPANCATAKDFPVSPPPARPGLVRYVRALIEAWIDDTRLNAAELARRTGLTPTAISDVRAEKRGIGLDVLIVLSEEMGFSIDEAIADAKVWTPGTRPRVRFTPEGKARDGRPIMGNLEGWAVAEAEARRRFRHIPSGAFDLARNASGAGAPVHVTPEWIGQLASVYAMAMRGEGEDVDPD